MPTLILNGSPRPNGDTAALIDAFSGGLGDEICRVDCYTARISPCVDCRACLKSFACAIQDDMQAVYAAIGRADNIVIASPLYYSELTGPLLGVLSRLQIGYYALRRGEAGFAGRPRRGGALLVGGGDGSPAPALARAGLLLRAMGCAEIADPVMSLRTDALPTCRDGEALTAARALGESWRKK